MFKSYFKIAWRNLRKHPSAGLINITGLSLGMAAAILIFLWVQNEFNFDNYHPKAGRIYHLTIGHKSEPKKFGGTPLLLAETAQQQVPEIEKATKVLIANNSTTKVLGVNNNFYKEKGLVYVDKEWFNIFHHDFIDGNALEFSQNPSCIIITNHLAKKYFGNNRAVGEMIHIDSTDYRVQAIVKDNPANSSFQFNIFLPMQTYLGSSLFNKRPWLSFDCQTFLRLGENVSMGKIEQKINTLLLYQEQIRQISFANGKTDTISAALTPLSKMHFDESDGNIGLRHGDKKTVYIFSILGFLLLTVACVNYVNLSTARASLRSKEVGIKKILGADRRDLFLQFMIESLLTGILALSLTILITRFSLPWFNKFTENNFELSFIDLGIWKIMGITLSTTLSLTGIYPALVLSSFKPLNIFKGFNVLKVKDTGLRKILVTSQFTIAIALTIVTIVILKQMYFIHNNDEGYNRSQIFSVSIPSSWSAAYKGVNKGDFVGILKSELSRETAISNITVSNDAIQNLKMSMGGVADWENKKGDLMPLITPLSVDADFRDIFKLKLKEGRWFQPHNLNDRHNYILNESAVSELGLKKPFTGQYFSVFGDTGHIIGVVKDFHFRDYHNKISSAVLMNNPAMKGTFFIQASSSKMKQALAGVEATWKKFFPREPFDYNFMDEEFGQMYKSDIRTSQLVGLFSGIAIFISCLGLFGLVSFIAEQRTKEIGIRKVLGATIAGIAVLLSKDFVKLVLIAIVIASPVAWWVVSKWLEGFVYRVSVGWWIFVLAGVAAIFMALFTVSFQAIKAAMANPVKSLRTE